MSARREGRSALDKALACAIVEWRNEAGWTQQQLADAVGVHRTDVSNTESGYRPVSVNKLQKFASVFGKRGSDLLRAAEGKLR